MWEANQFIKLQGVVMAGTPDGPTPRYDPGVPARGQESMEFGIPGESVEADSFRVLA